MPTIAFATLGCRVNQYDTDSMRGLFLSHGYHEVDFHGVADVYVINTCSVTQMGEKKSRQYIRRAKKLNSSSIVVVTGCYAQLEPEFISTMEGVDVVIGINEKHRIVNIVDMYIGEGHQYAVTAVRDVRTYKEFEEIPLYPAAVEHTRADLKIQEGCNNFCTYCIIPYTRGSLKSRKPDAVIEEAKRLITYGFKEIVLTGIHLGAYGVDLPEQPTLALILRRLLEETQVQRIRMGSIESLEVDEDLIAVINSSNRICPHLHLPLQSGSDEILSSMHRHYTKTEYVQLIEYLRENIHGLTVSTDLILGFPGETESLFQETLETLKYLKFSHIHAFPYSPRPGTPAASMENQVPEQVKKQRVSLVNDLTKRQQKEEMQHMLGHTVRVLIEKQTGDSGEGFSENYERVQVSGLPCDCKKIIVRAVLKEVTDDTLLGKFREGE
ncbi:MAG: tRNA (N(6)-L-threonylcarbamoyladenosine(37)-C(2))-methylthiotransferase MtaB [Megasphaera sp.]|jgi:threonylcarbamoyladenosine tRNA methylthiotransferase MtaB|uniref:tRNA (N(6)-L-threonylcarbamoyladenosine(37)-C(2))- methylthiotransferase MtaB n=1 Tax=Megasphaera sueciensis TaxID=349094 RepID=UPI003D02018A|nr:tRNA (N(6)-L-threonylcarbamoyladenosine(37)-C(2))-methylthiotransferase MtaB [Megasphaera sp.]MCI1822370.1 tRNA (N(6)-L-threonylcarbamoyladenosine(37)-C(2))-methylthiotransferase MtaB [Megasphaera sp.]